MFRRINNILRLEAVYLVLILMTSAPARTPEELSKWTVYITNDNCPDYTWGLTEEQTRKSFADIVRAHLDEMNRTDKEEPYNRDRYNMAVTQEALCFVEYYPDRKNELIKRIREGRVFVSPYLCNSLWAFQSFESAIRTFYPARRLEKEWGIRFDVAEHIEQPCLPWGMASILAGCGITWLSVPYYGYDSTFAGLKNPPLFILEGPDGAKVRAVMDKWASSRASYMQGAHLLRKPETMIKALLPQYRGLGELYPLKAILASGTHGDISPNSGTQARGFAEAIIKYNAQSGAHPKLVNATLPQFCRAVDEVQAGSAFLPTIRGCFGHSWDLWPVSLAKYVADMRAGERIFLSAESLLTMAAHNRRELNEATRTQREQAEWYLSMLSDHAWNGTNQTNKRHNADLRRKWSHELNRISHELIDRAWSEMGLKSNTNTITIFNSISIPRKGIVRIKPPENIDTTSFEADDLNCQVEKEDGEQVLYFISPKIAGFGLKLLQLKPDLEKRVDTDNLHITKTHLESPYYRLKVDLDTGGVSSIIHKATGTELIDPGTERSICQTVFFDGKEHTLKNAESQVVAKGPVLARLRVDGIAGQIRVTNFITVYAELDHIDFDLHIHKPATRNRQRLCQIFPVLKKGAELHIETTGAVLRPRPQPQGDLLPGADTRRFAVQGFVHCSSPDGIGVTIVPFDAYALRMDLDPLTFEALGNDQNYREVTQDQHGVTDFRFRYSLRAHPGPYQNENAITFSRTAAFPLLAILGTLPRGSKIGPVISINPARAIATCLKPADRTAPEGFILRLRETAGRSGPLWINLKGYGNTVLTDLLERDQKKLSVVNGKVRVDLRPHSFCALRLLP